MKPKPLFRGARVALLSTSGKVRAERLERAIMSIKELGLIPIVYNSCTMEHGYLAGGDDLRVRELNAAFLDSSIDGILCMRGGYGANRILPLLDYNKIAENPKVFCGYSDITAIHIALNKFCGLETYHTPMPASELYQGIDDYTMSYYKALIFGDKIHYFVNPVGSEMKSLVKGVVSAELVGGNLSLVVASLGTPYEIVTKNKILFLEDVSEEVYRIDGMLTHLRNAGKLRECAGIILGAFSGSKESEESSLTLLEVFHELIVPEKKPCIMNVACGHVLPTLSLPLGANITIDANQCKIYFT